MNSIRKCPCCGATEFTPQNILWPSLVKQWKLTDDEKAYIDRQQGLSCNKCHSNLRSMTLAQAIMNSYQCYNSTFVNFLNSHKKLKILEINEAGNLTHFFQNLSGHTLAVYPDVDINELPYENESFDLVIHSDTLEHVIDGVGANREVLRVLRTGGFTCYTIPVVIGRISESRKGKASSYHGSPGNDEYLVHTEYGADMWKEVLAAGFGECRIVTLDFPASVAIIGVKSNNDIYQKKLNRFARLKK